MTLLSNSIMNLCRRMLAVAAIACCSFPQLCAKEVIEKPWTHGALRVTNDGHYLQHTDGTPFFWLGDTGWLLPQRLDRYEAAYYLNGAREAGFNVVQVQTLNGIPAINSYGQMSNIDGFDFSSIDRKGVYGYWDHMDYIIDTAASQGIYIGMVCIWGGLVKSGGMDVEQARSYGAFLANRYKNRPNIVWIIGGDIRGDIKPEVWEALALSIKNIDKTHLMTFHPFGRTSSAEWFHNAEWLDFNMFQSGHRAYDQIKGDGDDNASAAFNEDGWRYVEAGRSKTPAKPILDGEPSYEDIPHGLHDPAMPRWKGCDTRRYAYWSVFAGACGHTYGHNSVMQMKRDGYLGAYSAETSWIDAMKDPGYMSMKHLKNLMAALPFTSGTPDQSVIAGNNGERYDRVIATRGDDYMLLYNYNGNDVEVDMSKISGKRKKAWWYDVADGSLKYIGEFEGSKTSVFSPENPSRADNSVDMALIVTDADASYILPEQTQLSRQP